MGCSVCKTLLEAAKHMRAFNKGPVDYSDLSNWSDESKQRQWVIKAEQLFNGCDDHQRFLHPHVWRPEDETLTEVTVHFKSGRLKLFITFIREGDDRPWSTSGAEFLIINNDGLKPAVALGRPLDRDFVDPELLKQWQSTCSKHQSTCFERLTTLSCPLTYLIDTERECLVSATPDMAYAVLSYVWGGITMLETTRANLDIFLEPGALRRLEHDIPATVRDSIKLVPLLGERYLWVDSLCIVQDDEESARLQIDQMAPIFEGASIAIVAADGKDANYGLRGLRHSSHARVLPEILHLTPNTSITTRLERSLHHTPWSRRGWTMQEQIFARRKIIFYKDTVQWVCRASTWYEDIDTPHDLPADALVVDGGDSTERFHPLDLSLDVPDLSILCHFIQNYNGRKLTYQEDVFRAITSTFGAMRRAFPRGFVHGLPVSFLDASLIWRSSGMTRRVFSREVADPAPSWTWAGWKGHFNGLSWTAGCYMKNQPYGWGTAHWEPYQAIPMLAWYTKRSKDAEPQLIAFQNEWHDYKTRFMGKVEPLPRGWTYKTDDEERPARSGFKDDPECTLKQEDLQTPYYYEHESCPGRKFWHPVPIGELDSGEGYNPTSHGRYLCAETQQARLWAAKPRYDDSIQRAVSWEGPENFVLTMFGIDLGLKVVLKDGEGNEIGELSPDSEKDQGHIWDAYPSAIPINIVAISRGLHFPDPQPRERETWSFYNVLWVAWEDGIASRKGIGRVKRSAWEGLQKEDVSLVLG
ncbi:heterokaryon incompatibility protein [Colletotrichum plurivorum]|uniref:Heterokaryon incompatibility protein n=1 Tax=Colletotrichum plurivorum TaxID=2175906 RepID=A0A8H6KV59_9PEZI|nr:heterokaryon incompatibility protein [Colletotrichum plurivorum]